MYILQWNITAIAIAAVFNMEIVGTILFLCTEVYKYIN